MRSPDELTVRLSRGLPCALLCQGVPFEAAVLKVLDANGPIAHATKAQAVPGFMMTRYGVPFEVHKRLFLDPFIPHCLTSSTPDHNIEQQCVTSLVTTTSFFSGKAAALIFC